MPTADKVYEQMLVRGETTIRVLLYLDDEQFATGNYQLSRLKAALERRSMRVEVRSRVAGVTITGPLLADYDEVWFFLRSLAGPPLAAEESEALRVWMDAGNGVLVTGDHTESFAGEWLGLGAPVGRAIPRAGKLRGWGKGPGTERVDSLDSVEIDGPAGPLDERQRDGAPQRLILPVLADSRRHPIFHGRGARLLDRLPDHMHEGAVRIAAADWAGEPSPVVIARGVDHWRAQCFDLMVAWDGHVSPGGAKGRILADSSWHHYVDFNLATIAEAGGEAWDKIQELYCNQAVWLAPPRIKLAQCGAALQEVAAFLLEEKVVDARALGGQALRLLARQLPGARFAELVPMLAGGASLPSEGGLPGLDVHLVSAYVRRYQRDMQGLEAVGDAGPTVFVEALGSYVAEIDRLRGRYAALVQAIG